MRGGWGGWEKWQERFIVADCLSFPQNGNPSMFGVGNIAAQPRSMQQPPAQPLNSSQPNPRAQVPPPLLSPQVTADINCSLYKLPKCCFGRLGCLFIGVAGIYCVRS